MKKLSLILINIVKNRFFVIFIVFYFFMRVAIVWMRIFHAWVCCVAKGDLNFCTCVIFCCGFLSPTQKVGMAQLCRTPC